MPRSLKIILAVVGIFALLVVGAALAGHYIVSRQDNQFLRQKIEARTLAATGFQLQVLGPMELPYSLIPSVVFRDIRLNNPEYEGGRNLLEAEELRIQFALIPLLKGEVVVYESSMYFVNVNLEVDEDGNENWITGGQSGAKAGLPAQIAVHTVDSHQLNISYTNLETGVQFEGSIDDINIRAPLFDDQIQVTEIVERVVEVRIEELAGLIAMPPPRLNRPLQAQRPRVHRIAAAPRWIDRVGSHAPQRIEKARERRHHARRVTVGVNDEGVGISLEQIVDRGQMIGALQDPSVLHVLALQVLQELLVEGV